MKKFITMLLFSPLFFSSAMAEPWEHMQSMGVPHLEQMKIRLKSYEKSPASGTKFHHVLEISRDLSKMLVPSTSFRDFDDEKDDCGGFSLNIDAKKINFSDLRQDISEAIYEHCFSGNQDNNKDDTLHMIGSAVQFAFIEESVKEKRCTKDFCDKLGVSQELLHERAEEGFLKCFQGDSEKKKAKLFLNAMTNCIHNINNNHADLDALVIKAYNYAAKSSSLQEGDNEKKEEQKTKAISFARYYALNLKNQMPEELLLSEDAQKIFGSNSVDLLGRSKENLEKATQELRALQLSSPFKNLEEYFTKTLLHVYHSSDKDYCKTLCPQFFQYNFTHNTLFSACEENWKKVKKQ